ncbi:SusC/RagA family TonB-linked outer membrane protein [Bacteroidia bacterium]|nr:SusC/RagA family TonB-linked outer membrane protein [Bacteroidia bacterium]
MRNIFKVKTGLLCLFLLFPVLSFAQSITVSGVVTDERGETLPGVTVSVPGANNGTISDIDGNYRLDVPSNGKLSFYYIGYLTQTVEVNGRKVINITLKEDTKTLDEVVVVGYGTMKKSDLTGAVTSVKADAIQQSIPTSIDQVLQGRAAGVQVQQNSGMPGASTSIKIRGTGSLNSATDPIYVIDGVVIEGGSFASNSTNYNPLASINPADIVSMDILKDASATAIYGSRGGNGVIMVTTKRGDKGHQRINYNGYVGWQQLPKKLDMLNLRQYAEHRNALADIGVSQWNDNFVRPDLLGDGTDWQSELFNTAAMHSHNLSVSGGTDISTYNLTAGYLNQDGIAAGSGFERLNLTGAFDANVKPWMKAGINFAFDNSYQKITASEQSLVLMALRTTPDVPVRNADGSYAASDEQYMPPNPMAMANLIDNRVERYGIRANTYANITRLFIEGLSFRSDLSFDFNTTNQNRYQPRYYLSETQYREDNEGYNSKQFNKYYNWSNVFTYARAFADIHSLNVMLGQEMSKSQISNLSGSRTGFITDAFRDLTLGDQKTADNDGYNEAGALLSYFGRAFYSLQDKYMLTFTLRRDGSSKFADKHKWGTFPSAAFAWRASEENFLKNTEAISNLKLRLGWGLVGNQAIPENYAYIAYYGSSTTNWGPGLIAKNVPNPDLHWETTSSSNIGFDLGLLKNRIELVLDLYYKKTNDLLMVKPLPSTSGTVEGTKPGYMKAPWVNAGSIENKGIELSVNTVNIQNKDFRWNSNFIFSLNRNKALSIDLDPAVINRSVYGNEYGVTDETVINRTVPGKPVGQFYGYQVIGRFEKATDFYRYDDKGNVVRIPVIGNLDIDQANGVWIGDYIYKDVNNDGILDEKDMDFIGNPEPKFTYGFGNTFSYKGIDLAIQLQGSYGNDVVNYARRYLGNPMRNISNLFTSALDYARLDLIDPNGPDDYRNVRIVGGDPYAPRLTSSSSSSNYNHVFSDRFIEDGSYLRIQNISIGYNLPKRIVQKAGMENVKIYANIQNLYTFTNYRGYDPEIGSSYEGGNWLMGIDNGRYPAPRIITFGLNLLF